MKHVWVYIILSSMSNPLEYPIGVAAGATEDECYINGAEWIRRQPPSIYRNVLAGCFRNEAVDQKFPTLRWL